jgi:general secretion pathway protein D
LRLVEPGFPRPELFRIARRTLTDYGVATRLEEGVWTFFIDEDVTQGDVPIIISGRALPDVPESHRPVFVFVPLQVVKPVQVRNWIMSGMQGKDIDVLDDPNRGAIVLKGRPAEVEQALAMVRLLDQPSMRGKHGISIEPAHAEVEELAKDLVEILKSEGYDASLEPPYGAVILLPLTSIISAGFAVDPGLLRHVEEWVSRIDKRQELSIEDGVFSPTR